MINLISPDHKRDFAAARVNVRLIQSGIALLALAAVVSLVYGFGFWLLWQDQQVVGEKLREQSAQSQTYAKVEKEANAFRQNLTIAKRILGTEKTYSSFLTTLAGDMPTGTVLTSFSIGGAAPSAKTANAMLLEARTDSYAKVLELKTKLEQSELFEDVNIVSAARPENITTLTGLEARYPYQASYNVKVSTNTTAEATR